MQVRSDISESAPFLVINSNRRISLLPVILLHEEAPNVGDVNSWTEVPHATVDFEFPLDKWVHVGCEVNLLLPYLPYIFIYCLLVILQPHEQFYIQRVVTLCILRNEIFLSTG